MKSRNFRVNTKKTLFRVFLDFFANLFFAYCLIVGLSLIMFSTVTIECEVVGSSMLPTLNNYSSYEKKHDVVFVNTYDKDIAYKDIVVCKTDGDDIIKRVIGLPGDVIDIVWDEYEYKVELNGKIIEEDYILVYNDPRLPISNRNGMTYTFDRFQHLKVSHPELFNSESKLVVPEGATFVLGDNRHVSVDSSSMGTFMIEELMGKVELIKYHDTSEFSFYYDYIMDGKFIKTLINIF